MLALLLTFCAHNTYNTLLSRSRIPPPELRTRWVAPLSHLDIHCEWDTPSHQTARVMMSHYFNATLASKESCEVFTIEDIPVAAFVFTDMNRHDAPIAQAFYINKAAILLCDVAQDMRNLLYMRHRFIDTKDAYARDDFLWLP